MEARPVIDALYLAHPVVGDAIGLNEEQIAQRVKENLARASRWLAWLVYHIEDVAIRCSWLGYISVLPETPEMRERGLRDDDSEAATCTGIVLCGGYLSSGMKRGAKTLLNAQATPGELLRAFRASGKIEHQAARYTGDGDPGCIGTCSACSADAVLKMWPPSTHPRYVLDLLDFGPEPPDWSPTMSRDVLRRRLEIARTTGYSGQSSVEALLGIAKVIK